MTNTIERSKDRLLSVAVLALGLDARYLVSLRGHNFDFYSFRIVADIASRGGNVYAETINYNYGPVWFNILNIFIQIASILPDSRETIFRYMIVGFLSVVDIGIFLILLREFGRLAAYSFFLNPVSIVITGYHNQFDNLAIFLGMLSLIVFGNNFDKPLYRQKVFGLAILGFSLMTKHLLFAFPFWLAVKQRGFLQKVAIIVIPTSIFLAGFIPYWAQGQSGIVRNLFMYQSNNTEFFYRFFVPEIIRHFASATVVWFLLLMVFAFVFRSRNAFDSILLYTCVLVATSPAMANQYLAIAVPCVAAMPNLFFWMYTIVGGWYVLVTAEELHTSALQLIQINWTTYCSFLVIMLCFGLVWLIWRQSILSVLKRTFIRVRVQLGYRVQYSSRSDKNV